MAIDTLRYANALKSAKVPAAQAEAHALAITDHIVPQLATKSDLEQAIDRATTRIVLSTLAIVGILNSLLIAMLRFV